MRACDIENRRVIMSTLNDEKIKGYLYREYGVETTSIPRNNELRIHFKSVRRNSEPYTAAKQVKSLFKPLGNVWENIKSNLYGSELVLVFNKRNSEEISHNLSKLKGGKERWMQRHDLDEDAKLEAYEALEEFRSRNIPDALMSMREGNQYFANGEVFPTYEDARNELEREEELNTQNESPFQKVSDSSFQQTPQNNIQQVNELFESNPELANEVYEALGFDIPNLPIIDTENIISFEGTKGAAQYDRRNNQIKVNRKFLKQKFLEKAWTKPRKLIEFLHGEQVESYAQALPENQFTTYQEWEQFVINHEYQHSLYSRQDFDKEFPNKTKGDYESEINRRALNQITPQQKQQARQLYAQYLEQNPNGSVEGFKNWINNNQTSPKTFSPNYLFTKDWNIKVPEVILETNDSNSDFNLSCIKK